MEDRKNKIAVTMPGKMGDALYAIGAIRYLCKKHNKKADFWTSEYCAPLKNLIEYQSCIEEFHVNHNYVIHHMNLGVQPWQIQVPDDYEEVYHLGFRSAPDPDKISEHICKSLNIPPDQEMVYEYPDVPTLEGDYIVIAPRGEDYWIDVIKDVSQYTVVQIGTRGDYVGDIGIDKTGLDFLETTAWIAKSKVFMGCTSSQCVIAEGFPISRYIKPPFQNRLVCKNLAVS